MAERFNGNVPYKRNTHGSGRRSVFSVPSQEYLRRSLQSKGDSALLRSRLRNDGQFKGVEPTTELPIPETIQQDVMGPYSNLGNVNLPIFNHRHEIVDAMRDNKALITEGATGSGKSTQLPLYLLEEEFEKIYIVEVRRSMVDGLVDRLRAELVQVLGPDAADLVGAIHGRRSDRHPNNKMFVLTPMTLLAMLGQIRKEAETIKTAYLMDEAHEDDPFLTVAMGAAAMAVRDNNNGARFIASSATINADNFMRPLGRITNPKNPDSVHVPVIEVQGRPFDVEIKQAPGMNPAEAYLAYGLDHKVAILSDRGEKQMKNIRSVVEEGLRQKGLNKNGEFLFRTYSGETDDIARSRIISLAENIQEHQRLVIIASPAIRSGVTIPGATFAATGGLVNREIRNKDGHWGLVTQYYSQAEIIQTIGRVGRDVPGGVGYICEPMPRDMTPRRVEEHKVIFPFMSLEDRAEHPEPSIFNTDISNIILATKKHGLEYSELKHYTHQEVNEATIQNATTGLTRTLGALDHDGNITPRGLKMSEFPVVTQLSRGLVEGLEQGRSRPHMARMALMAAAVDVGGVQDFRGNAGKEWKALVDSDSDDDFATQLNLMLALRTEEREFESKREKFLYIRANDLSAKRVEDAQRMAEKILRRLSFRPEDLEIDPPTAKELRELREDFTSGMYDQVYRDAGIVGKERTFTHIRDKESVPFRTISSQSVTEPRAGMIIAGIPQYYEEIRGTTITLKDVLAMTLKVEPEVIGRFAKQNHLVEYKPVKGSSRVNGGMAVERETIVFGSLNLGSRDVATNREFIPVDTQRELVRYSLQNPGPSQLAMRSTADELAEYRRTLGNEEVEKYRRLRAPVDFTKTEIDRLLKLYAGRTRLVQELDALLGEHAYEKNISIERYYDSNARAEMLARSPATLEIGGATTDIQYSNGVPYVTKISQDQEAAITGPVFLPDGREVLRQVGKAGGRGTRRISFGTN